MQNTKYSWVSFYEELADKLLAFKSNRLELIGKIKEAHQLSGIKLPTIEQDNNNVPDIDPFTVFALFNRGKQSVASRQKICEGYKQIFNINSDIPSDFEGVPMYTYNQYCFYRYAGDPKRDDSCFDTLWNLFEQALLYSKNHSNRTNLEVAFEQGIKLPLVGQPKMTMGLFDIRPNIYVNLDSVNIPLIEQELHVNVGLLSGAKYLDLCFSVLEYTKSHLNGSLPDFSGKAYELKQQTTTKTNDWEPSLEQYDPKLTKEDWLKFMRESEKFSENYKFLLAAMYDIGGQATCMQLEKKYGKSAASFNLTATHFAEHVQEFTKCPKRIDEEGKERYWSIPFVGRNTTDKEEGSFVWKLRPELKEAIEEYGLTTYMKKTKETNTDEKKEITTMISKNTILYGPPGTGKTYSSVIYAVAIIEGKKVEEVSAEPYSNIINRYNDYEKLGQIKFTTFHQSYGYEEFIEGIRPYTDSDTSELHYRIEPGLFFRILR